MENTGSGVQMSAGVVTPVINSNVVEMASYRGKADSSDRSSETKSFSTKENDTVSVSEDLKEQPSVAELIKFPTQDLPTTTQDAEEIFEVAKRDGVDAALERLASGQREVEDDENPEDKKLEDEEDPEFVEREMRMSGRELDEENVSPIEARYIELAERTKKLIEENKELAKKTEEAQKMARDGILTALELARVIQKLVEDEEDKEEHKNILQGIAALIAAMLIMLTVAEDQQKELLEEVEETAA